MGFLPRLGGGNPEKDCAATSFTPSNNDGKPVYKLNAKDVPVDGLVIASTMPKVF